jgi:hypothetical protein
MLELWAQKTDVPYWQQMLDFLHCFSGYEGERNWMGIRGSVSQRARDVVMSSFFSVAMTLSNTVDDLRKVVIYGDCPQEVYE